MENVTKLSGRRDSNPRPVAAATALWKEAVELVATASAFVIAFLSYSFCSGRKAFAVDQNPWDAVSGGFRVTRVVTANPSSRRRRRIRHTDVLSSHYVERKRGTCD